MPSFSYSQRHNFERLLALILLWNVVAGAFVTLGAPWLAEIAGTTGLRPSGVLPVGTGWLFIGVPTHFAGLWLPLLGVYALHRRRHRLGWHLAAVLFYAPQTFAITSPLHVHTWIGLYAATSFRLTAESAMAINWIAVILLLIHAGLSNSKHLTHLKRVPVVALQLSRRFWGSTSPLSRAALSRRYASVATITALVFLPLVPPEVFYPSRQVLEFVQTPNVGAWFERQDIIFWRRLLLLPVTFVAAYVMAFVWSGGDREPRFSTGRGVVAALLTYMYLAMTADLLSRWLSDGQEQLFWLFLLAWIYLLPLILLIPTIGAVSGAWLGRKLAAPRETQQRSFSRLTSGMWLTLLAPLLAILLSYALRAS